MSTQGFVVSHERDAEFKRGLRSFFEYRDLGIKQATTGRVDAHVIRAAAGAEFSSQPHLHKTTFQLVYILKGWIEFEYEGQGRVRLEAGSCVHQPPNIRHRELGHKAHHALAFVLELDPALEYVDELELGLVKVRLTRKLFANSSTDDMCVYSPLRCSLDTEISVLVERT